eukprot:TRINITY_DN14096_c0_g3_i1.p2 TRINITY_DN14096_c0_g3~~TRINITY_DN14096_c0_g3_i1.p2  ORF type:complete len:190 (-),score=32.61 TRINITY_DN14096_c0_g3_i1:245-814(-)
MSAPQQQYGEAQYPPPQYAQTQNVSQQQNVAQEKLQVEMYPKQQVMDKGEDLPTPPRSHGKPEVEVIWEGETWDACPICCMFCAPLCCRTKQWRVTNQRIDTIEGCCGSEENTLDIRRITDIGFQSTCCVRAWCCGRGTVLIKSDDATHPLMEITMCCNDITPRELYRRIRDSWTRAKIGTAVQVDSCD